MSKAVDSVAKSYISNGDIREGILNRVEAAIRAYDPCLSCSTHAVGSMPLIIECVNQSGKIIETLYR